MQTGGLVSAFTLPAAFYEDKLMEIPEAIEHEKKLISGMWLKDGVVIPDVAEIVTADDFYRPEHRIIYSATVKTYEEKGSVDILFVEDELKRAGQLEKVGRKYLFSLLDYEFTTSHAVEFAKEIRAKAQKRRLLEFGQELIYYASEDVKTVEELMAFADEKLQAVPSRELKTLKTLSESAAENIERILFLKENPQSANGLTTGLYDLNKATGGLKKTDLIILAARPGMGKTALALNIAMAAAKQVPTLMFSLEMSEKQLNDRALSLTSRINLFQIQTAPHTLQDNEITTLYDAVKSFGRVKLTTDDTGGLTLSELRMRAKHFKRKHGLGLIVVDYIQLIQSSKEYRGNRVQEVSEISRGLKALAKELDVPILALSQLSRSVELRAEKRPQLSDLRESGSIEQDADIVMFLYREAYYDRDDVDKKNIAELIIAKNRNGATGSIKLYFEPEYQFFGDLTREG